MFDWIPGAAKRTLNETPDAVWQILPEGFVIKEFYRRFSHAAGELGEGELFLWPDSEIAEMRISCQNGGHPDNLFFFGGDGCGNWFGVYTDQEIYFALASISDPEEDISKLGKWDGFRKALENDTYF